MARLVIKTEITFLMNEFQYNKRQTGLCGHSDNKLWFK